MRTVRVPGRVNILGEHTDRAQGQALAFAVDRWLTLRIHTSDVLEGDVTELWSAAGGGPARIEVDSEIPIGVGLSSSAALCIAVHLGVHGTCAPEDAQRLEHEVLGTPCGLLDQLAILHAREDEAVRIDFATNTVERFPLPDWRFLLFDSGVERTLAETGYAELDTRDHAVLESRRVEKAMTHPERLGSLLDASHRALIELGVSTPEVDQRVAEIRARPGVFGARMIGGGFGGFILALVEEEVDFEDASVARAVDGPRLE